MNRNSRKLSEETKKKISASLKGRPKDERHKRAISIALKRYWKTIPNDNGDIEKR